MVTRIDAFTHILPRNFYKEMAEVHPTDELRIYDDMNHVFDTAIEDRLAQMDELGIDKQVLTLLQPTFWRGINREDALRMTRLANDAMARIAAEHPNRFLPVGTLPYLDGEFLDEIDRCIEDLGMIGIQTFSNIDGRPLDAPKFHPFFERLESYNAPLWIHPQIHEWFDWGNEYMLHKLFGWPFDTSMAIGRLVLGGILEQHPGLNVITHHMGGMIPHFEDRIEAVTNMNQSDFPYLDTELSKPAIEQFRQIYADTALQGTVSSLECGFDFFGPDQILFATDYPLGPEKGQAWVRDTIEAVEQMDIDDKARERIFAGNIHSLLER